MVIDPLQLCYVNQSIINGVVTKHVLFFLVIQKLNCKQTTGKYCLQFNYLRYCNVF